MTTVTTDVSPAHFVFSNHPYDDTFRKSFNVKDPATGLDIVWNQFSSFQGFVRKGKDLASPLFSFGMTIDTSSTGIVILTISSADVKKIFDENGGVAYGSLKAKKSNGDERTLISLKIKVKVYPTYD